MQRPIISQQPRHAAQRHRHDRYSESTRRGAALVEFAFVAPVFLTLILGTIEIGNALEASSQLNSALREAGRLATMDWTDLVPSGSSPNEKVIQDIRNFLTAAGYPGDDVTISITAADGPDVGQTFDLSDPDNKLELFQIEASIPFEEITTFPHGFMNGRDIRATYVMRAGKISLMN